MSFEDQLDRALRALHDVRIRVRKPRVTPAQSRMVNEALGCVTPRRGGKPRRSLPNVRLVSLKLSEPPRLKLSVDGHGYAYAGDGAVMVYAKGLLTRRSKRARVDGLNHARANLTLVGRARRGGKHRRTNADHSICDNCGRTWRDDQLAVARHLWERVDEGGEAPTGACPACGALCYTVARSLRDTTRAPKRLVGKRRGGKRRAVDGSRGWRFETDDEVMWYGVDPVTDERTGPWSSLSAAQEYANGLIRSRVGSPYESRVAREGFERWKADLKRRGGKRRFDPAQLKQGVAAELEHAATIKKIVARKLPVKKAAELIAKDHLRKDSCAYVATLKHVKGLKPPRLKLYRRHGKLRIYIINSNATRKIYGDFVGGGHDLVYPDFVAPFEIWLAEELIGIERDLYLLHEANERGLMAGGMDYDTAHDKSTALEQRYRKANGRGLKSAINAALRRAVGK